MPYFLQVVWDNSKNLKIQSTGGWSSWEKNSSFKQMKTECL